MWSKVLGEADRFQAGCKSGAFDPVKELNRTIAEIDAAIETAARRGDGYDGLISIEDIEPGPAGALLSGIGNVTDLGGAGKLGRLSRHRAQD